MLGGVTGSRARGLPSPLDRTRLGSCSHGAHVSKADLKIRLYVLYKTPPRSKRLT